MWTDGWIHGFAWESTPVCLSYVPNHQVHLETIDGWIDTSQMKLLFRGTIHRWTRRNPQSRDRGTTKQRRWDHRLTRNVPMRRCNPRRELGPGKSHYLVDEPVSFARRGTLEHIPIDPLRELGMSTEVCSSWIDKQRVVVWVCFCACGRGLFCGCRWKLWSW